MRRKVTYKAEVGYDWICPLCDKSYGYTKPAMRIKAVGVYTGEHSPRLGLGLRELNNDE